MTIFHIWPDTELKTLILGAHLETRGIDLVFAAVAKICVTHPHFRICSGFAASSTFEASEHVPYEESGSFMFPRMNLHTNTVDREQSKNNKA